MSAPSGNMYAVGMKHARVYVLNTNGVPNASGTVPYEGIQIVGAKAYELNVPDARRISHTGDDRVLAQDVLPRTEASTGTLRWAADNHAVYAALTSTTAATIGEASVIGYATDKQGSEPTVALLCYQQAKSGTSRVYRSYQVPNTQAIVNPNSMNENAAEFEASLLPSASTHHVTGLAFATGVEGFTQAEVVETLTYDLPLIVSWKADGTITAFKFASDHQAVSTAKIHQVVTMSSNGGTITDVTGSCTKATDGVTITGPLGANTIVSCFYEYAD